MDLDYVKTACLDWIQANNFRRVLIQFKQDHLDDSVAVSNFLKSSGHAVDSQPLEVYVTKSNTCCVDLLVTQHVSNIDGIIHVGNVCVAKPELRCDQINKPVLFVFGRPKLSSEQHEARCRLILREIRAISEACADNTRICLFYDANMISFATNLETIIQNSDLKERVDVANLHNPLANWTTTADYMHKFVQCKNDDNKLGYFALTRPVGDYDCAIYLGENLSIQLSLTGPRNLSRIHQQDDSFQVEKINVSRVLNRRIALVDRLKDNEELKIGVIITNPLPDIDRYMAELESIAKARRHILYFISMIQTTDEYKMGNFDLCDAFVVINSCFCSTILESLVFNRPILTALEFKLACGFEARYGGVLWPGFSSHQSEEDLINKRKVSDISLALVHTRNELLERCSLARVNKWSGLDFKATLDPEKDGAGSESLDIEEGLTGIASSYSSEPVKRG